MNLSAPPPNMHLPPPNLSEPPPNMSVPPPGMHMGNPLGPPPPSSHHHHSNYRTLTNHGGGGGGGGGGPRHHFRPFLNVQRPLPGPLGNMTLEDFDGKRLRKSVMRKTVDYNSSIIKALETRVWQRDARDRRALQPDVMYYPDLMPPPSYPDNPINCVTTRFVKTATNKMRCPIFCMAWTPEGRRLVTGASSGEFTLWNGLTFNFETILQAHDSPVRTMVWSHNDSWMVTGDHAGYVKYWQSNMNNVKMFQAHKEALRGISFSPTDSKFVTCSDDGTLRIWDFFRYQEEKVLRGHGADVKCVHWHPQKGLIISGSKDNQQPIKLWDPKTGQSLATLHAHKSTVMDLKWNDNGNWLITASRDHLLKLFDLRNLSQEVQTFRGHKKEASSVAWHPHHEGLFCSGGSDGSIMFWHVGADKEVGAIEQAHDSIVWTLAWHPLGHILCSGSNDHTSKFWTRNRPGDQMRDKYNLNTLPPGVAGSEDVDVDEPSMIPGMGPEDKVEPLIVTEADHGTEIPGLDLDAVSNANEDRGKSKKVPYSKPIPRNFQAQWNETGAEEEPATVTDIITQIVENTPGVVPLQKITPNAIIVYGKLIPVVPGSKLEHAIAEGPESLQKFIDSGQIEELHDVMPHNDDEDFLNQAYVDENGELIEDKSIKRSKKGDPTASSTPTPVWERPPDLDEEMRAAYNIGGTASAGGTGGGGGGGGATAVVIERDHDHGRELDFRQPQQRAGGPPFENFGNHMRYEDDRPPPDMEFDFQDQRRNDFMPRNGNGFFNQRNGMGMPPPPVFMGNGNFQPPPGFPPPSRPPPDFRGMGMGMNMGMNRPPRANGNMRGNMNRGNMPRPRHPGPHPPSHRGAPRGRRY